MFVVCSVAGAYVSLRRDPRVYFIEFFLSLLCFAVEGERIVWVIFVPFFVDLFVNLCQQNL